MDKIYLMYHDIVTQDDKSSGFQNESAFQYKVTEDSFENHVKNLKGKEVVFTFDDGGVSFYSIAAPILEKYGQKGIFFIAVDFIGTPGFLTKEQIVELQRRGHVIGSHSCSHPQNMAGLHDEQIRDEWLRSTRILSEIIGQKVTTASLPNGNSSKTIIKGVKLAGINELYTSEPTTKKKTKNGITTIGRYVVHANMATDDILRITNDDIFRRKKYIKWMLLSAIKSILGSKYKKFKSKIVR